MVSQHHGTHPASGQFGDVLGDVGGFGQRRPAVDHKHARRPVYQSDGDIEEGKAASVHAAGKTLPVVVHPVTRTAIEQTSSIRGRGAMLSCNAVDSLANDVPGSHSAIIADASAIPALISLP